MTTLQGCPNFRDLGGHETMDGRRVRTGRVFRSDSLHGLTGEDVSALRQVGVTAVYDLRMPAEVEQFGVGPLYDGEGAARYVHAPLFEKPPAQWLESTDPYTAGRVGREYVDMLELGAVSVRRIAADLGSEDNLPAVFHCMAGRDRTGAVAAVFLSALGVPMEEIAADYALTGEFVPEPEIVPAAIEAMFERLDREYGSPVGYLRAGGVTTDQLDRIRQALLD